MASAPNDFYLTIDVKSYELSECTTVKRPRDNTCDFERTFAQECLRTKEHVKNLKNHVTFYHTA